MKKEYVLPVCFAAAAHGALLFGFSQKTPRAVAHDKDKTNITEWWIPPREEDPVVVERDQAESRPKSGPEMPPPVRSPEPPVVDVGDRPTIQVPPIAPIETKNISTIPPEWSDGPGGGGKFPGPGSVLDGALLDNPPRTRLQVPPSYPMDARHRGVNGTVTVEFMVDERGNVIDPRVVNSTDRVFEDATLRAVAKWRFEPGRRDGKIVRFRMSVPVVFNLND